jgi:hypothetical protein
LLSSSFSRKQSDILQRVFLVEMARSAGRKPPPDYPEPGAASLSPGASGLKSNPFAQQSSAFLHPDAAATEHYLHGTGRSHASLRDDHDNQDDVAQQSPRSRRGNSKCKRECQESSDYVLACALYTEDVDDDDADYCEIIERPKKVIKPPAAAYARRDPAALAARAFYVEDSDDDSDYCEIIEPPYKSVRPEVEKATAAVRRRCQKTSNSSPPAYSNSFDPMVDVSLPATRSRSERDLLRLDAAVAQQLNEQYQQEQKAEALAIQEAKSRHEQGMSTEPFGRAVRLVEHVTQVVNDIANGLEISPVRVTRAVVDFASGHDISPVAVDDMVFLAEKLFVAQERFKCEGKSYKVDIGFHYTRNVNMERIRTDGLLNRVERAEGQIKDVVFNGAAFGEGIYTGTDPFSYRKYGDVGLMVARLAGNTMEYHRSGKDYEMGNDAVISSHRKSLLVLKDSHQCLAMVKFKSSIMGSSEGVRMVALIQLSLQNIVDGICNMNYQGVQKSVALQSNKVDVAEADISELINSWKATDESSNVNRAALALTMQEIAKRRAMRTADMIAFARSHVTRPRALTLARPAPSTVHVANAAAPASATASQTYQLQPSLDSKLPSQWLNSSNSTTAALQNSTTTTLPQPWPQPWPLSQPVPSTVHMANTGMGTSTLPRYELQSRLARARALIASPRLSPTQGPPSSTMHGIAQWRAEAWASPQTGAPMYPQQGFIAHAAPITANMASAGSSDASESLVVHCSGRTKRSKRC